MKYAVFNFKDNPKEYIFKTELKFVKGNMYGISTGDGFYNTPVIFLGYVKSAPKGINIKEITDMVDMERSI